MTPANRAFLYCYSETFIRKDRNEKP